MPYQVDEIVKKNLPSAIQIKVVRSNGNKAQGSGFFISKNGIGISNFHVFKDAKSASITTYDSLEYQISAILGFSIEDDLILFKIDSLETNPIEFSRREPKQGEVVVVISSPLNYHNSVTSGYVSGFPTPDAVQVIQIDAAISSGSSGGMVLNDRGQLIGVAQAIETRGQNLNFAIPANSVQNLYYKMDCLSFPQEYLHEIRQYAKDYYTQGIELLEQNKIEKASTKFSLAIFTDPAFARGYFGKGRVYKEYGDTTKAMALLAKSKEIYLKNRTPSTAPEFFFCGEIAWESNNLTDAKQHFEQAAILRSNHGPTHRYLGLISLQLNEWENAEFEFQRAIRSNKNNVGYYILLTQLYLELGRIESAKNVFHQLNKINSFSAKQIWQLIYP